MLPRVPPQLGIATSRVVTGNAFSRIQRHVADVARVRYTPQMLDKLETDDARGCLRSRFFLF